MGCIKSKKKFEKEPELENTYSWTNKEKIDPKEYTIENSMNSIFVRKAGSLNGTSFVIQNLESCSIYLFDYLASVSIDNCKNCVMVIGPTKTSVLIRNCSNCKFMVGCQQFRTCDCNDNVIFLHCITKPNIESSTQMKFACYSFFYPELSNQFKSAGLSVFNNLWNQVYDFNALDTEESNWSLLPASDKPEDYFLEIKKHIFNKSSDGISSSDEQSIFGKIELSLDSVLSVVPKTSGLVPNENEDSCLVVLFADGNREIKSKELIKEIEHKKDCILIHTKEFIMKEVEALTVFGTDSYNSIVSRGPLIALQYSGPNCHKICHDAAKDVALKTGSTGLVYVSGNNNTAKRQIALIFNELLTE